MIISSPFRQNELQQEIFNGDISRMPYICFYRELDKCIGRGVPWHWHPFFEIDLVTEGEAEYRTTQEKLTLKAGDIIFFNSNILHTVTAEGNKGEYSLYAHLFNVHYIAGNYESLLAEKYVNPVIRNKSIEIMTVRPDEEVYEEIKKHFINAVEFNKKAEFGHEFKVRNEIDNIWMLLLQKFDRIPTKYSDSDPTEIERVKKMILYIQNNFSDNLSLEKIAAEAGISIRECTRCFRRNISVSPMKYLNDYRIQMAAQMLLQEAESIMTISEKCGFSSMSYFGKVFKEAMNCTPREFRNNRYKYVNPASQMRSERNVGT